MPKAEALAVDPACLTGVDDLLTLGDFNEPALNPEYPEQSLRERVNMGPSLAKPRLSSTTFACDMRRTRNDVNRPP